MVSVPLQRGGRPFESNPPAVKKVEAILCEVLLLLTRAGSAGVLQVGGYGKSFSSRRVQKIDLDRFHLLKQVFIDHEGNTLFSKNGIVFF